MSASEISSEAVAVRILPHGRGLPLPGYQSAGAAGADLYAALEAGNAVTLAPGARAAIPTGICVALPPHLEAQVRPRSGLAVRHGVTVLNAPGTIDSDYRGEVAAILINLGQESFTIVRGERIAQLVIVPIAKLRWQIVDVLAETERGSGGFGSTGL